MLANKEKFVTLHLSHQEAHIFKEVSVKLNCGEKKLVTQSPFIVKLLHNRHFNSLARKMKVIDVVVSWFIVI